MKMRIENISQAYLLLHFCIFLWGFTAILGKWINLSGLTLVWWRLLFTCISLLFIVRLKDLKQYLTPATFRQMGLIGVLVAVHWVCFYMSIKYSNASVALVSLATTSFFASIIEPMIVRSTFRWYEMLLGILIIPGMLLIARDLDMQMLWGFVIGLLSAFFLAIFSSLNKRIIAKVDVITTTFVELSTGLVFLSLILPIYYLMSANTPIFVPGREDILWLLVLSLLCTTVPYVLSLVALRHLSAFTSALALNMEPVYGILLAVVLLNENKELSPSFYTGGAIIMAAVFGHPFLKKIVDKKSISTDHA